jgi:hypothetical protein
VCTRGKIAAAASHLQALSLKRMNKKMVNSDIEWRCRRDEDDGGDLAMVCVLKCLCVFFGVWREHTK